MDLVKMLRKHTGEIMENPFLSDRQQEERITQVFDLCHFIKCYDHHLELIDIQKHELMTINDSGTKKGVYFCDLIYSTRYFFDKYFFSPANIATFKKKAKVEELWFVLVEESFSLDYFRDSRNFIAQHNVDSLYDKIFYFNFSRSIIKTLK